MNTTTMTRTVTKDTPQNRPPPRSFPPMTGPTAEVSFHCASGQSHGPDNVPATAAGPPERDRKPCPGWTN